MKIDLNSILLFVIYCVVLPVTAFLCELKLLNGYLFPPRRTSGSFRELYDDNAKSLKKNNAEALKGGDEECK